MRLSLNQKYIIGLKELKMTQNDLGKELGFSRNYMQNILEVTEWVDFTNNEKFLLYYLCYIPYFFY